MVADILRHGLENPWCYDKLCHFYQSHEKCIGMMLEWYAIKHDKSQIESLADLAVHSDSDALSDIPYVLALFAQREWQGYMIDTYR
jgi:hypothetical protein